MLYTLANWFFNMVSAVNVAKKSRILNLNNPLNSSEIFCARYEEDPGLALRFERFGEKY